MLLIPLVLVSLFVGVLGLLLVITTTKPQKYRLRGPPVLFPLPILNRIDAVLSLFGIRLFKFKREKFIAQAKQIAKDSNREVFGSQEDLVEGITTFCSSLNEESMCASGVLLVNGFFERILNTREAAVKHINQNVDVVLQHPLKKPFIISGLPRTGSTMLYNLMACDPDSRAPRFFEMSQMSNPFPPCSKDLRDSDPRIKQVMDRFDEIEKLYPAMFTEAGKSHRSHPNELEEELLVLFQGMILQLHVVIADKNNDFREWFERSNKDEAYRYMRLFLQSLNSVYTPESHWVLKAPVHSFYLESLMKQFPDANVVITSRDPTNVVPSWATLIECYMGWHWTDHTMDRIRFGRYIMDSLLLMSRRIIDWEATQPAEKYFNVNYEKFIKDPVAMVERIYNHFGMQVGDVFRANMVSWIADNRQGKYGRAPYALEDYNLNKAQVNKEFAEYNAHFLSA